MRYKVAPPVRSLDFLADARKAVPLVPRGEADCCGAIQRATGVDDREVARTYLTFMRALGLVTQSDRGYHRTRTDVEAETLATAFTERVFLVEELLETFEAGPLTADVAFEAVRDEVPRWERERTPDWEGEWREKVARLLSWAVVFDLLTVVDGTFAPAAQ